MSRLLLLNVLKAGVYNAYGRPNVLSKDAVEPLLTWVSSLLTATSTMASLFSLLQVPVVYSCVAGVERGGGLGGRGKREGSWEEGPVSLLQFSPPPPSLFAPATQGTVAQKAGFSILRVIKERPIDSRKRTRLI